MWKRRRHIRQWVSGGVCVCEPLRQLPLSVCLAELQRSTHTEQRAFARRSQARKGIFTLCAAFATLFRVLCVWPRSQNLRLSSRGDQDLATPFEPRTPHLQFRFFLVCALARERDENLIIYGLATWD